ncbi:hypothetical protein [Paenibacillus lutimineralis]|uniref:Uncharacterized protein n=1 Tax=Paenibacillus lutimineralis TaxID=2707005 RepID=A0A3S9V486_9BACL|nr:hypothetical protein [Paenibacillus lutimineralis]AZS17374.1 hypothetical protein EI981_25105 [Paenibacillus lutimineralis]
MNIEKMMLQQFIDAFFEQPNSTWYERPILTLRQSIQKADWYPVAIPGAIAVYRYSGFTNIDDGYAGEPPVLLINRQKDCISQT